MVWSVVQVWPRSGQIYFGKVRTSTVLNDQDYLKKRTCIDESLEISKTPNMKFSTLFLGIGFHSTIAVVIFINVLLEKISK